MHKMSYITRWLFSTSHKDIAILYLGYGMISSMVATAMSVIIRLELSGSNPQFLQGNNQVFNVMVTGHAIAMIFLFVMPVLIGAFGNYFLPIMIGGVDMAFARLNNISFWCLPPALVCTIASVLTEQGPGVGWTVWDKLFLKISFDAWKTLIYLLLVYCFIKYSIFIYINIYIILLVIMFMIIGLYACIYKLLFNLIIYIHQRLNKIIHLSSIWRNKFMFNNKNNNSYLLKNKLYNIYIPSFKDNIKGIRHYHTSVKKVNFNEWLVGFTDGDGTFNIYINDNKKVSFTFKLSQSTYNEQILYKIKDTLDIGRIVKDKTMSSYVITRRDHLINIILPIFNNNKLLTSKYFNYLKFKESLLLYDNKDISIKESIDKIKKIKEVNIPLDYKSPIWNNINIDFNNKEDDNLNEFIDNKNYITSIMTKSWLIGFIEAEGSFYLTSKSKDRIVHGFGITQKLDYIVLYCIKYILNIKKSFIVYKHNKYSPSKGGGIFISKGNKYYILDTTNSKSIENIIKYFITNDHSILFMGVKNLEFSIWKRSYYKFKGNYIKLKEIKDLINKIRNKHKLNV